MQLLKPALRLLTAAGLAFSLTGCVFWAPSLEPLRQELETTSPLSHLDSSFQLRLGRLSLGLARSIAYASIEDDVDAEYVALLRHVKGVELAIYEVEELRPGAAAQWNDYLRDLTARRGWQTIAQVRDDDSSFSSVMAQTKNEQIRGLWIFTLDDENLTMVRLKGRFDQAIAEAIAMEGAGISRSLAGQEASPRIPDPGPEEEASTAL